MEFRAIKITGLMGKIGLGTEHSKPVQSVSNILKTITSPIKYYHSFKHLKFLTNKEILR
jgi:hypothetical protein